MAVLVGILAVLEGEVPSGEAALPMTRHLSNRLGQYELPSADATSEDLAGALSDLNRRLRVARGAYDGVP